MRKTCAMSSSAAIERARALAHRHGRDRQLVERHGRDGGGLGQAGPHIGEHDDHQRRQVEQHDQPGVAQPVGDPRAAHHEARTACRATMAIANETATRASVAPRLNASAPERASLTIASATDCGSGSMRGPANLRAHVPGGDQQRERDEPQRTAAPRGVHASHPPAAGERNVPVANPPSREWAVVGHHGLIAVAGR